MPRYIFKLFTGEEGVFDGDGTELPSLDAAEAEAIKDARLLMSSAILRGHDVSGGRVEICDEAGNLLRTVLFKDTIRPRGG